MIKVILILSIAGVLFSGYLSGVKLLTDTCALGESCPYFLGYPACWYGFTMYLIMFVTALLTLLDKVISAKGVIMLRIVSGLGILFAGYFTVGELPTLFSGGLGAFVLGLPTCAWGLLMYIAIFIFTFFTTRKKI